MKPYWLSHLSDPVLLRDLTTLIARDRTTSAALLAHVAEVGARSSTCQAAYPSMFAYCAGELRLSEDTAFKRIKAARAARRCPAIIEAVAQGRLHLSAVVLLAPHLTEDTADELLAAATHKRKSGIERLLAERFPQPDALAWVESIPTSSFSRSVGQQAPGPVGERSRVEPLTPQSFAVQFTLSQRGHDPLRYAQELLGHQIPSGDLAAVIERALDALIPQLEQRKFAAAEQTPVGAPGRVKTGTYSRGSGSSDSTPQRHAVRRHAARISPTPRSSSGCVSP